MRKIILYVSEQKCEIPQNTVLLTKEHFQCIEKLKEQNRYYWQGTLDTLVSAVSVLEKQKGLEILNILLKDVVAILENKQWNYYTCNAVIMNCCAGEYIRIVNKTKIAQK